MGDISWMNSGLLDGLTESQSRELAAELDKIANFLLSLKDEYYTSSFIFPVIRRLYKKIDKYGKFSFIVDVVDLFWDIEESFKKFKLDYSDLFISNIDAEAEFCAFYCDAYIEDLKKRKII